jgi:hypothetical protein
MRSRVQHERPLRLHRVLRPKRRRAAGSFRRERYRALRGGPQPARLLWGRDQPRGAVYEDDELTSWLADRYDVSLQAMAIRLGNLGFQQ